MARPIGRPRKFVPAIGPRVAARTQQRERNEKDEGKNAAPPGGNRIPANDHRIDPAADRAYEQLTGDHGADADLLLLVVAAQFAHEGEKWFHRQER